MAKASESWNSCVSLMNAAPIMEKGEVVPRPSETLVPSTSASPG